MTKALEKKAVQPIAPATEASNTYFFDEHAQAIAKRQYMQPSDGDVFGMFKRIADWVSSAEKSPELKAKWGARFYDLIASKHFCPGGRVLAGAGTQHGNVLNCFVQGATENEPSSFEGVMEVAKKLALVTKVGGGNGVNLDVYTARTAAARKDAGIRGWAYMSSTHADVEDFVRGLMRPPTQPDGAKQPTTVRNWSKVVYGIATPELTKLCREHGVTVVAELPANVQVIKDDMGGIVDAAREVCELARKGTEPRIDLTSMRAEGAPIKGSGGTSSGPVSFLFEIFDNFLEWANLGAETSGPINTLRYCYSPVLRVVRQGGTRRGAGMATISIDHTDVLDFLTAKDLDREASEGDISTFNISILATDKFIEVLERDGLWNIQPLDVPAKYYAVKLEGEYKGGIPNLPVRDLDGAKAVPQFAGGVPAKWIWRQIAEHAWSTGEPGLIFNDRVNAMSAINNLGPKYQIKSTNPCVTAETWVNTRVGPRQVEELIGQDFCAVVDGETFNAQGGFWLTGVKPVFKLRTKRGYELRLTGNHRLKQVTRQTRDVQTTTWTETEKLELGDKIMLSDQRSAPFWAGAGNHSEGWLIGNLIGDGTFITDKAKPMAALDYWGDDRNASADRSEKMLRENGEALAKLWRSENNEHNRTRLSSENLATLAAKYGVTHGNKTITDQIEKGNTRFYAGFLQGLFDADGSVQGTQNKGISVRLAQSDLPMLQRAQRMLARLGILSSIFENRREAGTRELPDGRGGSQEYNVKAQHELVISGENLAVYAERIGFSDQNKTQSLETKLASYQRKLNRERFSDEIISIEPDGVEAVYDVTVETAHAFDANAILAHNCGEIPLTVGEPCDLGAINLAAYVHNSSFDFAKFRADVRDCIRFLDDVLDVNKFALEDNRIASQDLRRLGLGVMGLADALIKMGLRYDRKDGREMIDQIMSAMREEGIAESQNLGLERGVYPVFERNQAKMPHAPRRNVAVLTVAPTGTTSMLMGVSSGIEPVFSPFMWRKIGSEYKALVAPLFQELLEQYPAHADYSKNGAWDWDKVSDALGGNHGSCVGLDFVPEAVQACFVCAHDIAPLDHVRMQGTVQEAFDREGFAANSLSKTINMPNSATVEEIEAAYTEAYKTGCKGITVYRDGSRQFQVLSVSKDEKKEETAEVAAPEIAASSNPASNIPEQTSNEVERWHATAQFQPGKPILERPTRLTGVTDMVKLTDLTAGTKRTFLITTNSLEGKPVEVVVVSGRAGDEANADSEALGRVVSIALQYGVPADAIQKTLRGINGGLYGSYNGRLVASKADLIAVALESTTSSGTVKPAEQALLYNDMNGMTPTYPAMAGAAPSADEAPLFAGLGRAEASKVEMKGEKCPSCSSPNLVREEGCLKCQSCGYSKCG
jgi:ribonucleoside-diphosphate reductase alpha chain